MRDRFLWALLAIVPAVLVAVWRFLALNGFSNDHYVHLAGAQQMLFGEWPSRDFVDAGAPLMFAVSAAVLWMTPEAPLFGEALLVAAMFGLGATCTVYAARRLTGSMVLALLAVALEIVIFPRTYSYPKILTYAAGFLAMWRYVDRPSLARMVQMSLVVVLSFLLRYDHGIYLGAGGLLTVILTSAKGGAREAVRSAAIYALVVFALLAPYGLYVGWYDGLGPHILRGLEARALEDSRGRRPPLFTFDDASFETNAVAWLYYLFHVLPIVTVIVAYRRYRRSANYRELAIVAPLVAVAVPMNLGLIRETLTARLPDAIVPACLQLVWLLACARGLRPLPAGVPAWTAAAAVVVISAASVTIVGTTREQLDRAELLGGFERLQQQFHDRADQLHARFSPQQIPSRVAYALMPFFAYADRCLGQKDHVLVPAFLPEVSVWSRQPFAGGQILFQPGVLASEADHRLVMDRLGTQRVPVAVLHPASDLIAAQFGELAHYIRTHFTELTAFGTGDGPTIRVGFDPRLASGRDSATGWFCYQ